MTSTGVDEHKRDDRGIAMNEQMITPQPTATTPETGVAELATLPVVHPAGWYTDPSNAGGLRYYDGSAWTEHRHTPDRRPQPPASTGQQIVVNTYVAQAVGGGAAPQKSGVLAFILTFFFGPLGMLYSTVTGGLVMLVADIILVPLTFGLAIFILWPIQLVWAVVAASNQNRVGSGSSANAGPAAGQANQVW